MVTRLFTVFVMLALLAPPTVAVAATMPSCRSGDPVVWVNTNSHVYHLKGDKYYGNTKAGDYECQSKAVAGGSRASGGKSGSSKTASSTSTSSKTTSSTKRSPASMATDAAVAPDASTVASPAPMKKKKKHAKAAATPAP